MDISRAEVILSVNIFDTDIYRVISGISVLGIPSQKYLCQISAHKSWYGTSQLQNPDKNDFKPQIREQMSGP